MVNCPARSSRQQHELTLGGTFAPYHGIAVSLAFPISLHDRRVWGSANDMRFDPDVGVPTMVDGSELPTNVLSTSPSSRNHVGPGDLRIELLRQFDVIIFPGGSGSKQGKAIGELGRDHVRQFARGGGGIIGICAGAYLCSSHYTWSLNLMNAAVFNKMAEIPGQGLKSMWYRGPATDVDVEVTRDGKRVLGIEGLHSIRYQNGPILSPGADPSLPSYQPLAFFRTENGIYQPQQANTMIGSPAVVACQFGEGRVVALSPHFESTKGCEAVILRVIEHVCRKP